MQRIDNLKVSSGMQYIDNVTDILYLTGQKLSAGTLLVFPEKAVLFVDSRYIDACKKMEGVEVHLAQDGSLEAYLKDLSPQEVLVDGKTLCFDRYKALKKVMPDSTYTPTSKMDEVRAIKDASEIKKMKVSGALNHKGCMHAISSLKEGMTEKEVAWEYEKFCRKHGGECLSFETIVAFDTHSAYPHHHCTDLKLEAGMNVLIDCGITVDNYTSDMTRSLFFKKEANPEGYKEWKHLYDIVMESYSRAASKATPGVMFHTLDEEVQQIAKDNHVDQYEMHTLGHSLGLDVHEWPRITYRLKGIPIKENMIFTIEPGLYKDGSCGIRYENTLLMTAAGSVIVTQ